MILTLLGTGTSGGVPAIGCKCDVCTSPDERDKRFRTSALLQKGDATILIDAGPDLRSQALRIQLDQVDAVLLTHEHRDHIGGIDDLRSFDRGDGVDVFGDQRTLSSVRQSYAYIFSNSTYPGVPRLNLHLLEPYQAVYMHGIEILPITVMHHKLPVIGFIFDHRLAYITDANAIPPESMAALQGIDTIVINALRQAPHISHFSLQQAIEAVSPLKPNRIIFTHIAHDMGLHASVQQGLPPGHEIGVDGMKIEV